MKKNHEIKFIKPCRYLWEDARLLTPEYALAAMKRGRVVQIGLDNCSIQRMEMLPRSPTLADAESVGLLPLVELLASAPLMCMSSIGVNEMPDNRVAHARDAYENFCKHFWPGHRDDVEATERSYDPNSAQRHVSFTSLSDGARLTYGCAYISLMQMQNIARRYPEKEPEQRFEIYMHSIIGLLDIVSAFELELAKYAFWQLTANQINMLPEIVQTRRRDIKDNFTKLQPTLEKCRLAAYNGAMDIHWLSGSNFAEDLDLTIDINGLKWKIDCWVATNDHKLYRICEHLHSVYGEGSNMMQLAATRESLESIPYWRTVDEIGNSILRYRKNNHIFDVTKLLARVDCAVEYVENELSYLLQQDTGLHGAQ